MIGRFERIVLAAATAWTLGLLAVMALPSPHPPEVRSVIWLIVAIFITPAWGLVWLVFCKEAPHEPDPRGSCLTLGEIDCFADYWKHARGCPQCQLRLQTRDATVQFPSFH